MRQLKFAIFISLGLFASTAIGQQASSNLLFQQTLSGLPNSEGLMVTVDYPPGVASPIHRHNAHTFVYVLEGAVVMQVEGSPEVVLSAGETFYETPEDIHLKSANASDTEPAKILVFFVKATGAPPTVLVD
jgi:quercetin dioxygenase-like cupin family protein